MSLLHKLNTAPRTAPSNKPTYYPVQVRIR